MGFPFNHIGNGCMTRRPIQMIIENDEACEEPRCALVENGNEHEMSLAELQRYIAYENARLGDEGRFESEDIIVAMKYKRCADIIITDTPGAQSTQTDCSL